jgi:hypothetical protein
VFFSFWVLLLGSSGFFWCSSVLSNARRTPEEHQKERQKNPEGEEHQPPELEKDARTQSFTQQNPKRQVF